MLECSKYRGAQITLEVILQSTLTTNLKESLVKLTKYLRSEFRWNNIVLNDGDPQESTSGYSSESNPITSWKIWGKKDVDNESSSDNSQSNSTLSSEIYKEKSVSDDSQKSVTNSVKQQVSSIDTCYSQDQRKLRHRLIKSKRTVRRCRYF